MPVDKACDLDGVFARREAADERASAVVEGRRVVAARPDRDAVALHLVGRLKGRAFGQAVDGLVDPQIAGHRVLRVLHQLVAAERDRDPGVLGRLGGPAVLIGPGLLYRDVRRVLVVDVVDVELKKAVEAVDPVDVPVCAEHVRNAVVGLVRIRVGLRDMAAVFDAVVSPDVLRLQVGPLIGPFLAVDVGEDLLHRVLVLLDIDHAGRYLVVVDDAHAAVPDLRRLVVQERIARIARLCLVRIVGVHIHALDLVDRVGIGVLVDRPAIDVKAVGKLPVRRDQMLVRVDQVFGDLDRRRAVVADGNRAEREVHAAVGVAGLVARIAEDVALAPVFNIVDRPDAGTLVAGIPVVKARREGDGRADLQRVLVLRGVIALLHGSERSVPAREELMLVVDHREGDVLRRGDGVIDPVVQALLSPIVAPVAISVRDRVEIGDLEGAGNADLIRALVVLLVGRVARDRIGVVHGDVLAVFSLRIGLDMALLHILLIDPDVLLGKTQHHMVGGVDDQRLDLAVFDIVIRAVGQRHIDGRHGFHRDVDVVDGVIACIQSQLRILAPGQVDLGRLSRLVGAGDAVPAALLHDLQQL